MGEIELDAERQLIERFLEELVKAHLNTYGEMMIKKHWTWVLLIPY